MESLMLFKDINWKSFGIVVAIMAGTGVHDKLCNDTG